MGPAEPPAQRMSSFLKWHIESPSPGNWGEDYEEVVRVTPEFIQKNKSFYTRPAIY